MKILSASTFLLVTVAPGLVHTTSTTTSERRSPERVRGGASPRRDVFYSEYSTAEGPKGENDAEIRSGGNEYYSNRKSLMHDFLEEDRCYK